MVKVEKEPFTKGMTAVYVNVGAASLGHGLRAPSSRI